MIISSFNSECELLGILNELDKNKQLSIQCCLASGATIILIKRWVTLIVIIIMQPCLWNAEYAIMYGLYMQESPTKSHNVY